MTSIQSIFSTTHLTVLVCLINPLIATKQPTKLKKLRGAVQMLSISNNLKINQKMSGRHSAPSRQSQVDGRYEQSHSSTKEKSCVPSFISKTYEILEKQEHSDLISWSENGLSFYVKNIKQFEENILPIYFRHKNFASFVRQLNMYDFHKVRGELKHIFSHKLFQKDQKQLLSEIKRKCFKKQRENSQDQNIQESNEPKVQPIKPRKPVVKQPAKTHGLEEGVRRKRTQPVQQPDHKKNLQMIQKQIQRNRERNTQLMNQMISKLKQARPQSDREIRQKLNELKHNPKYEGIMGKYYVYEIYKKIRDMLFESRPKNTLEQLDELSIEEDILYNQIQKPSKFRIASLTNFQTENFLQRSDRQVIRTITGDMPSRDFF